MCRSDGAIVDKAEEGLEGVMEGEEGGGWEVGDDELELPPDLVSSHLESLPCDVTVFAGA